MTSIGEHKHRRCGGGRRTKPTDDQESGLAAGAAGLACRQRLSLLAGRSAAMTTVAVVAPPPRDGPTRRGLAASIGIVLPLLNWSGLFVVGASNTPAKRCPGKLSNGLVTAPYYVLGCGARLCQGPDRGHVRSGPLLEEKFRFQNYLVQGWMRAGRW
eukprot:scaffold1312_cov393-Prasinococcus_capsulatus_cf.AAC.14